MAEFFIGMTVHTIDSTYREHSAQQLLTDIGSITYKNTNKLGLCLGWKGQ